MTKFWSDVYGYVPGEVFNAHTGPAAQMCGIDDFQQEGFDCLAHGFVGGATFNIENQKLPLGIARDPLPPELRAVGPAVQGPPAALAERRSPSGSSRTPCRTRRTSSTSIPSGGTAAASACPSRA